MSSPDLRVYIGYLNEYDSIDPSSLFLALPITTHLEGVTYVPERGNSLYKGEYTGTTINSLCFRVSYAVVKIFKSCIHLCGVRDDRVANEIVSMVVQLCKCAQLFLQGVYDNQNSYDTMPNTFDITSILGMKFSSKQEIGQLCSYLRGKYDNPRVCSTTISAPAASIVTTKHKYQVLLDNLTVVPLDLAEIATMFYEYPDIYVLYNNLINSNVVSVQYISGEERNPRRKKKQNSQVDAEAVISNRKLPSLISISGLTKEYAEKMHNIVWSVITTYLRKTYPM